MNNRKIALLAIPVFAAIMMGATVAPAHAGLFLIVSVDIKPGSDPNSINTFGNGVIPVAILGSAFFDVADIDVTTLAFGPAGAAPTHRNAHLEDVNDDGFPDLVSHYRTQDTGIVFGDTIACISGELVSSFPFGGCDGIITVPNP